MYCRQSPWIPNLLFRRLICIVDPIVTKQRRRRCSTIQNRYDWRDHEGGVGCDAHDVAGDFSFRCGSYLRRQNEFRNWRSREVRHSGAVSCLATPHPCECNHCDRSCISSCQFTGARARSWNLCLHRLDDAWVHLRHFVKRYGVIGKSVRRTIGFNPVKNRTEVDRTEAGVPL